MIKRWTAYKIEIKDIVTSTYSEDGFILLNNQKIQRVRVIATIVSRFISDEKNYGFIVLDDGTETIRVKAYKEQIELLENLKIGDIIEVFGKIKEWEDEIYIIPESIVLINDPNWEVLRKFELANQKKSKGIIESEQQKETGDGDILSNKEMTVVEEIIESPRQKLVKLIEKLDKGDGASILELKSAYDDDTEIETVITELMNEGEIFEPRPGKIKILV